MPEAMVENRKKSLNEKINHLTSLTQKHSLNQPSVLYRIARNETGGKYNVGEIVTEKGFLSTSLDPNHADKWVHSPADHEPEKGVILKIHAPKGTRGFDVDSTGRGYNENEFLLPPGTRYQINSKKEVDGKIVVAAQIIPPIQNLPAKKLSARMLLPKASKKPSIEEKQWYMKKFLKEFGATLNEPAKFIDAAGAELTISTSIFYDKEETLKQGTVQYKVTKEDRERYLLLMADTIKHPTEIWVYKPTPTANEERRYISIYRLRNGKQAGYAVFHFVNGEWKGTTTYSPSNIGKLEKKRQGKLVYNAEEPLVKAALLPAFKSPDLGARPSFEVSGTTTYNISPPKNEINKSHNPLYFVRGRGC
jgi:hypothetical protein